MHRLATIHSVQTDRRTKHCNNSATVSTVYGRLKARKLKQN